MKKLSWIILKENTQPVAKPISNVEPVLSSAKPSEFSKCNSLWFAWRLYFSLRNLCIRQTREIVELSFSWLNVHNPPIRSIESLPTWILLLTVTFPTKNSWRIQPVISSFLFFHFWISKSSIRRYPQTQPLFIRNDFCRLVSFTRSFVLSMYVETMKEIVVKHLPH